MESINFMELFGQGGISLVVVTVAYKMVTKLYTDMRDDSKSREDKLMLHLEKQGTINERVADTLDKIDDRLCTLEEHLHGKGDVK